MMVLLTLAATVQVKTKEKRIKYMFKVKIFTLYPEFFPGPFNNGIYGKAIDKKIWNLDIINIRDYLLYISLFFL